MWGKTNMLYTLTQTFPTMYLQNILFRAEKIIRHELHNILCGIQPTNCSTSLCTVFDGVTVRSISQSCYTVFTQEIQWK